MQTGDSEGTHSSAKFLNDFFRIHLNILEILLSHSLKRRAGLAWLNRK